MSRDEYSERRTTGTEPEFGIEGQIVSVSSHVAYFWETEQEFKAAVGFLEAGLLGKDHCVIFGHEDATQRVSNVLEQRGHDMWSLREAGRVSVVDGDPSASIMLEKIGAVFGQALQRGAPLIRLLGNIGWGKGGWPQDRELFEFEARVTQVAKQFPSVVVCMYNTRAISGDVLRHGGVETHPFLVFGPKTIQDNPYYVPAETFLQRIETIAGEMAARKRVNDALRTSEQQLQTLLEINNVIVSKLTRDELFTAICDSVARVVPYDRMAFSLYEPESDSLRIVTYSGPYRRADYSPIGRMLTLNDSPAGLALLHQKPVLRRDLETERTTSSEERAYGHGFRSLCALPLIVHGKSIGAITVGSLTSLRYSESDAAFLMEVAKQIAIAVENMRSYEEIAELKARLQAENVYLQEEIKTEHNFEEIIGQSAPLQQLLRKLEQVAPTDSTVLIMGETGTGKELLARAIHHLSRRKDRPLVKVNCGSIPTGLVESELFGHEKGAFTGATQKRIGRFELAHRGTIFLDEVSELPPEAQVKLLRVLQEAEFERVGSSQTIKVDTRVIAASNRDLNEVVRAGGFRADLFYRLNVVPLEVPPLRERRADISLLVSFFVSKFTKKLGKQIDGVSQKSMERLVNYSWPGNIRELQNAVERAVVLARGRVVQIDESMVPSETCAQDPTWETLENVERNHIVRALAETNWVIHGNRGAAALLGINPSTLRSRMEKLGIKKTRTGY